MVTRAKGVCSAGWCRRRGDWGLHHPPSWVCFLPFQALCPPALCPRRLTLWDGITRLDSGVGVGQGGEQEHSVGEKVERMYRT